MNAYDRAVSAPPPFPASGMAQPDRHEPPRVPPLESVGSGLGDTLSAIWRQRAPLAAWVVLCLALATVYLWRAAPEYTATAEILLETRRAPPLGATGGVSTPTPSLDSPQAESQIHVVQSERVLKYVFDTLDLASSPDYAPGPPGLRDHLMGAVRGLLHLGTASDASDLLQPAAARARAFAVFSDRVGVRRIGQSYVLEVSFRASQAQDAARRANAIASAYIRDQVTTRAAEAQRGLEYLQNRIELVKAEQDAADAAIRSGTVPDIEFPDSDARIISAALVPLAPSAPQKGLILAFAGVLSLATGLGLVALRHSLDRTVRTGEQVWSALHVDCLGTVPSRRQRPTFATVLSDPETAFAAGLRTVRNTLLAKVPKARPSAIGLLACDSGAGTTTLTANLGYLLAGSAGHALLLDADLRKPALSRVLAPTAPTSLAGLLGRGLSGSLPLVRVEDGLDFLPAVPDAEPSDPNLFVGSATMQGIVTALRAEHFVLVDLPALDRSYDGQAIAPMLDGLVLVAEAGRTTLDELSASIRTLQGAGGTVLGVILNRSTRS